MQHCTPLQMNASLVRVEVGAGSLPVACESRSLWSCLSGSEDGFGQIYPPVVIATVDTPKAGCSFGPSRAQVPSLAWAKQHTILRDLHFPDTLPLQILTQEDWNKVLYNGMASTSSWAALYFIALMTFGNYVLFNLLVAILVEGFQTEVMSSCSCLCFLLKFQGLQILEIDF